ncbi:hypothetical protein RvVAT039_pl03300 (plasmid) [Agrobacterium vitis]|nr:hypothetical protein RvVAT039_pl03300 [Agrobacterium vitis]
MNDQEVGDGSQVGPLLEQIDMPIWQFTADGAYDGETNYDTVPSHSADAAVVIPLPANAVERQHDDPPSQRDRPQSHAGLRALEIRRCRKATA